MQIISNCCNLLMVYLVDKVENESSYSYLFETERNILFICKYTFFNKKILCIQVILYLLQSNGVKWLFVSTLRETWSFIYLCFETKKTTSHSHIKRNITDTFFEKILLQCFIYFCLYIRGNLKSWIFIFWNKKKHWIYM